MKLFKNKYLVALAVSSFSVFLLLVNLVNAQPAPQNGNGVGFPNPLSDIGSFPQLLNVVVNDIVLPIGSVIVVLALIISGFLYVRAQGKPEELQKAHRAFMWTAVGALIILGAWAIAEVICTTMEAITGREICYEEFNNGN